MFLLVNPPILPFRLSIRQLAERLKERIVADIRSSNTREARKELLMREVSSLD